MRHLTVIFILTVIVIGSPRAGLNFNRDDIVQNARVGINLLGSYNQVNINLNAQGTQFGGHNSSLSPSYLKIQKTINQIYQLKLKLNPALNTSYN